LKKPVTKRAVGMTHGIGPEFKPQYCKKKIRKKKKVGGFHLLFLLLNPEEPESIFSIHLLLQSFVSQSYLTNVPSLSLALLLCSQDLKCSSLYHPSRSIQSLHKPPQLSNSP
jgi:hypothetical protein